MPKNKLDIIYEDKNILVINKKSGLNTIGTDKDKYHSLYHYVYEYVHKKNKNNRIFIVHRLDRDTSGVILFSKSDKLKKDLQDNWDNYVTNREYIGIIEGHLKDKKGSIKLYLHENSEHYVYVTDNRHGHISIIEGHLKDKKGSIKLYLNENSEHYVYVTDNRHGHISITNYEVIKETKNNSVVRINIETGRKNQIRVVFAYLGHPLIGDKKYGSKYNNTNMLLHAYKLKLYYPVIKKEVEFVAPLPSYFNKYIDYTELK